MRDPPSCSAHRRSGVLAGRSWGHDGKENGVIRVVRLLSLAASQTDPNLVISHEFEGGLRGFCDRPASSLGAAASQVASLTSAVDRLAALVTDWLPHRRLAGCRLANSRVSSIVHRAIPLVTEGSPVAGEGKPQLQVLPLPLWA